MLAVYIFVERIARIKHLVSRDDLVLSIPVSDGTKNRKETYAWYKLNGQHVYVLLTANHS